MRYKVYLLFVIYNLLNLYFNAKFDIHFDEAYYWTWSRHLDFSYYDHPPMIAYLIRSFTIFSNNIFFIRLVGVACGFTSGLMIYLLALRMFNPKVANISLLLLMAWPIFAGINFIITPDSPLIMFWSLSLYFAYLAINEAKSNAWPLLGIFIAAALLSKYTAILLIPSLILIIIVSGKVKLLFNPKIYLMLLLALILFSPVIYWNYIHHWLSFRYQLNHGVSTHAQQIFWPGIVDYLINQLAATNPIIFLSLSYYLIRYYKNNFTDPKLIFLICPFLTPYLFFLYNSGTKYQEGNWAAPAYISAIIFLAYYLAKFERRWIYNAALALMLIIIITLRMPTIFLPNFILKKIGAVGEFYGQKILYTQLKNYIRSQDQLFACSYGVASRMWYYLDLSQQSYMFPSTAHANEYTITGQNLNFPLKQVLFVCDYKFNPAQIPQIYFKDINYSNQINFTNGFVNKQLYLYRLHN